MLGGTQNEQQRLLNRSLDAFHTAFHANGGNAFVGPELSGYLRGVGITDVNVKLHVGTINSGEYRRTHLLSLVDVLREKVVGSGVLTDRN